MLPSGLAQLLRAWQLLVQWRRWSELPVRGSPHHESGWLALMRPLPESCKCWSVLSQRQR